MLDPVPRRFHRVRLPVSSSVVIGLPQRRLGSAFPRLSANHDFSRPVFSRLQIFLNVPASKFARPPDRLYRCAYCRRAAGAFTSGQYRASLPPHAPDMLTVRIQAIDSTGTFTLLDSQPCRLLTFAPRALPRFIATTNLAATVSPLIDFPVEPVIRPRLLHRFLDGARTASPVAQHVLVIVLSLTTPPKCNAASVSLRRNMLPSPRRRGLGLRNYFLSRPPLGSLALRPDDSLTIQLMDLSVGFIRFVSSTNATQVTELLTIALVGLTPTEHASLRWTDSFAKIAKSRRKSETKIVQ